MNEEIEQLRKERDELAARCARLRQAGIGLTVELGEQSKALYEDEMADVIAAQKEWDAAAKEDPAVSLWNIRADAIDGAVRQALASMPWQNVSAAAGWRSACQYIKCRAEYIRQIDRETDPKTEIERRVKRSQEALDRPLRDTVKLARSTGGSNDN